VSDAVDWDERYRSGDTPWEKGRAHPALPDWLRSHAMEGRVLVPGCGSGHDVRAIAATGAESVGFDIAESAVRAAESVPRVGNEVYVCGDLFDPPEAWTGAFDWVFEHTCFCAIPPEMRGSYVDSVARLLKPGGRLLAIFFINPDHDEAGPPFGCPVEELEQLFSPFFFLEEERENLRTFEGREGRERLRVLRKRQGVVFKDQV
jgi:SAM-dependent methyltransferase